MLLLRAENFMTEHEKRLREWIQRTSAGGGPLSLDLAEECLTRTLAQARADALEEAATCVEDAPATFNRNDHAERIRRRKGAAPPAPIPVEREREVARENLYGGGEADADLTREETWFNKGIAALCSDLGVPLDGVEERKCKACGTTEGLHNAVGMRCAVGAVSLCLGFVPQETP